MKMKIEPCLKMTTRSTLAAIGSMMGIRSALNFRVFEIVIDAALVYRNHASYGRDVPLLTFSDHKR